MEIKKSFKKAENKFLLVSVKTKSNQSSSVYVVDKNSIESFIQSHLNSDTIILIDSVETFIKSED
jgi:hypothetical protein